MCVICMKNNEFDMEHVVTEIKKLDDAALTDKAQQLKQMIRKYEIWSRSEHCDGYEKAIIAETLRSLKETQYRLNQRI